MQRDLRDPALLGEQYRLMRQHGASVELAVQCPVPDYSHNPTVIDRYGRPDEIEPVYLEIRVK